MNRRDLLIRGGLLAVTWGNWQKTLASQSPPLDAIVSADPGSVEAAAQVPDNWRFESVGAALAAAPVAASRPYRIGIDRGRWHEKLVIDKPNIQLIGIDREHCILSYDAAAGMLGPDGQPWGTWGCASVIVRAPDFRAENLAIENAFDYVGHLDDQNFQPIGANGLQGVALMLDKGADRSVLQQVTLRGHQDTLFADAGRSLFRRCHIAGSVDFIFGAGQALFDRCELLSRFRPGKPRQGYIAAPSTLATEPVGLLFESCRLLREAAVADASVVLGRAWRPTRDFADGRYGDPQVLGSAVYKHCWMDAHIDPLGWEAMAYSAADGNRLMLQPEQARLFEYRSEGPGAHRSPLRRWLDDDQAEVMDARRILADWDPA